MTKHNWEYIYQQGQQLNRYPYDFVVSQFFRYRSQLPSTMKVLDLGCGAGNHSIFCAENGARVHAVDFSHSALEVVKQRAEQQGVGDQITTEQVDFDDFNVTGDGFDLVIDRLAVTHAPMKSAFEVYQRVFERMSDGGILLANVFSMGHSHKDYGRYDSEKDVWVDFSAGIFQGLLSASFYHQSHVEQLLESFKLLSLSRESEVEYVSDNGCLELWKIIAQK